MQHEKNDKIGMQEIMYLEVIALVGVGDLTHMHQEPNVAEQLLPPHVVVFTKTMDKEMVPRVVFRSVLTV